MSAKMLRDTVVTVINEVAKEYKKESANPYEFTKSSVLLKARQFNQTPINSASCFDTLARMLHIIFSQSEVFSIKEESDLFFGVTKLFQSEDPKLRRMVHLAIKSLNIGSGEEFIVISSLTKDMNSGNNLYRANSIRVLSHILDSSMALQLERFFKSAIIDKDPFVASAAIVCALSLIRSYPDVVRRWINEVYEASKSKNVMVQAHALNLLFQLKNNDRLAMQKIILSLISTPLTSSLAECLLIRYATKILFTGAETTFAYALLDYLERMLRHRSDIVVLEAARAMCKFLTYQGKHFEYMNNFLSSDFTPLVNALQMMLSSPKSIARYAAIKTLNELSQTHPNTVARCNIELDQLLTDSNRTVATMALITLLKCGHEQDIEGLLMQISTVIQELPDGYRVEVLKAVRQLVTRYQSKYACIMSFLSTQTREEGSFAFKSEAIYALIKLIQTVPKTTEAGLLYLCEFIEDCDHPTLCIRCLDVIGEYAASTPCPSKYIRYIYNRLILETEGVRAAAIGALMKIASVNSNLHHDILILMESCSMDTDGEIRDQISLYINILKERETNKPCGLSINDVCITRAEICIDAMLEYLKEFQEAGEDSDKPLDFSSLPTEEDYINMRKAEKEQLDHTIATAAVENIMDVPCSEFSELASKLPSSIKLDGYHHCCKPLLLTEKEAEYPVQCIKHIYSSPIIILEFQVSNTMQNQKLEDINIVLVQCNQPRWNVIHSTNIAVLAFDETKSCLSILEFSNGDLMNFDLVRFEICMKYQVKEIGEDFPCDDSIDLEPITISPLDYTVPNPLRAGKFKSHWTSLGDSNEVVLKLSLAHQTLDEAVPTLIELLNLESCDGTETVLPSALTHDLLLSGKTVHNDMILCRCMLVLSSEYGCLLKAACRSTSKNISETVLSVFNT